MILSTSAKQLMILLPLFLLPLGILVLVGESAIVPETQAVLATQADKEDLELHRGLPTLERPRSRKDAGIALGTKAGNEAVRAIFVDDHSTSQQEGLTGFLQISADWLTSVKQGNFHLSLTASENGIEQRPGDRLLRFSGLTLGHEFRVSVRSGNNLILEEGVRDVDPLRSQEGIDRVAQSLPSSLGPKNVRDLRLVPIPLPREDGI